MLRQIAFGSAVSLFNIAIHTIAMVAVIRVVRATAARWHSLPTLRLSTVMIGTVWVLMVAHICEIVIWSFAYGIVDAAPQDADPLYFAFVNFTTLGYGDIVPVRRWRLLGPMTAMNGVLLFGWSTAVIFHILSLTIRKEKLSDSGHRWGQNVERHGEYRVDEYK